MKYLKILRLLPMFLAFTFAYSAAFAQPSVTEHRVNGYRVVLVNMHTGNEVMASFHVPTGSFHDDPKVHAGLSHLWEHVIHRGTEKFPDGMRAVKDLVNRSGGSFNASTAPHRVFYYQRGHPAALEEMIQILGAQASAPAWNEEYFQAERRVVMDEAKKYQADAKRALSSMMNLHLLPKGHPFAMYNIGSQSQLAAVQMGDLKDLYYNNYRNDQVTILVAGNFDNAVNGVDPLEQQRVLSVIAQNFIPPKDPRPSLFRPDIARPGTDKVFPSTLSNSGEMLEVKATDSTRMMLLQFEFPTEIAENQSEAVETLGDFLYSRLEGGLYDQLRKKDLITEISMNTSTINNLTLASVTIELTENGANQRASIPAYFYSALAQIARDGISEANLKQLKNRNIAVYSSAKSQPSQAIHLLTENLKRFSNLNEVFSFQRRYQEVSSSEIQALIPKLFDPKRANIGYMGPDVTSDSIDPVFEQAYRFVDKTQVVNESVAAYSNADRLAPILLAGREVPFQISVGRTSKKSLPARELTRDVGTKIWLQEDQISDEGALIFTLKLFDASAKHTAARSMALRSFKEQFRPEIDFLASQSIQFHYQLIGNRLDLVFSGNARAVRELAPWFMNRIKGIRVTSAELARATKQIEADVRKSNAEFNARHASRFISVVVNEYASTKTEVLEAIQKISPSEIASIWKESLQNVDLQITAVGNFTATEVISMTSEFRQLLPKSLTPKQRIAIENSVIVPGNAAIDVWRPLTAPKGDSDFGIARIYRGPEVGSREHIAMMVGAGALGTGVSELNRSKKGLGYIHSAGDGANAHYSYLMLYGETAEGDRWGEINEGWETIARQIKDEASEISYENEKLGTVRSMQLVPAEFGSVAHILHENLTTFGRPDVHEHISRVANEVSSLEINAVLSNVLNGNALTVYATRERRGVCKNALSDVKQVREILRR